MSRVAVFYADGFEEVEALAPVDLLRRGGVDTVTVSIMGREVVHGSHLCGSHDTGSHGDP